ncbi:MAG: amidohydrolase family protein [Candidatus Bathyarchaeota archaeon]|nr:MAG: amidohydrolase family protein [Candidatus Bathyarchaeota archaeon]
MRLIDSHVHIGNNPKWAPEAINRYLRIGLHWRIPKGYRYYPIEFLKSDLDKADIHGAVVFAFCEDVYRVEDSKEARVKANKYILEAAKTAKYIYPFYFVWNDYIIPDNLQKYAGIKWHRHYDEPNYYYNDPKCYEILERIKELSMPVLIEDEYNETVQFVEQNSNLNIIIPHCGKRMWIPSTNERLLENFHRMEVFFKKPNVYFDTGGVDPGIPLEIITKVIKRVGPKRVIMGSDTPYNTPKIELEKLLQLDLNEAEQECIFSSNIERLIVRWLKEYPDHQLQ